MYHPPVAVDPECDASLTFCSHAQDDIVYARYALSCSAENLNSSGVEFARTGMLAALNSYFTTFIYLKLIVINCKL